jgi:hypothetical protein
MRLLFPKIEVEDEAEDRLKMVRARAQRRVNRPMKRHKNLAY